VLGIEMAIDRMKSIDWFARTGAEDAIQSRLKPKFVDSWKKAIELRGRVGTANAFQEAGAMLTRDLGIRFRTEYRNWNNIVRATKTLLEEEVFPVADAVIESLHEIQAIKFGAPLLKDSIRWDLISYVTEQVYSDLVPPGFYTAVLPLYQAGHFPCGWDEKWPDGILWLY